MGNCFSKKDPQLRAHLQEADAKAQGAASMSKPPADVKPVSEKDVVVDMDDSQKTGGGKRRAAVRAEETGSESPEEFLKTLKSVPKTAPSRAAIERSMKTHFLFARMKPEYLQRTVDVMFAVSVKAGDVIIKQGDKGDNFYVIEKGDFEALVDGNRVFTYSGQGSFGDLALMYNAPRAATVRALTDAQLWAIDRLVFRRLMIAASSEEANERRQFLHKIDLLKPLSEGHLTQLVDALETEEFPTGHVIIRQGDAGDKFFILMDGEVSVTQKVVKNGQEQENELLRLGRGAHFGERALLTNEPRAATVKCLTPAVCLSLGREEFVTMLGSLQDVLDRSLFKMVLKSVPLLAEMDEPSLEDIIRALQRHEYRAGDIVIREGDIGETFYIIIDGEVDITKEGKTIGTRHKGDFFGERALEFDEPRAATVVAKGDVKLVALGRAPFQKVRHRMKELAKQREAERARVEKRNIKFQELNRIAILGKGTFGTVWLVHHKPSKESYAMKVMQKMRVINYKQVEHVKKEKELLNETHHPFLLNLVCTFQDPKNLYLVCELVQGGELFSRLQHVGKFDERTAKFYAGCVISAFEYLHSRDIIYRDLKPENMLIDKDGYAKIVDFGFAKKVPNRTFTLCGTPDYLAPEIIASKGHNKAVDWWAVGVLIYEMLGGFPPFFADDPMQTYQKIMAHKVKQPAFKPHKHVSKEAMDLIYKLLNPNPAQRYGCLQGGATDVKSHPWFKGFDWEALEKKSMKPPYVPTIKDALDTSNFDEYSDDDEPDAYHGNDFDGF
eukprot:TRINITY_DN1267_c0_g1::TRINITY_DN1267_c0_g1_i1::g.26800::m.26800 TRINITY_DN1267_c0_g1::TRINITY_DN1267_c0_g1_i1::g.26800  ORF type:complete len:782 (-),score=302.12,sp/P00516/KGP1_BOVIN/37.69/8e-131,sp/P00516/KGP1_BOVIN/32.73/3e-38,sp/P00516/KGP1_BOVIN/31.86/2e-10,Pkinase/PF00069.20/3.8e+03,Pkinase/PF00069.20/2.1e-68,cNMP_binding/PF00027.24/2e-18,cNMP_binding/PF00027.24/3.5e-20,cNMP_binding/PF00027.24/1.2e-18,Pkinase_Tyr/PF07714.12/7.3e+02,Pkinase_Tyr/PF07714.12/1.2e-31,Kinase-like/PF14531.1/5.7e+